MSVEDRLLSSYYPTDLIDQGGWADLDNRQEEWGIELQTKNVTPSGLTIVCEQFGGENVFELNTGSYFVIQKLEETGNINVEYLPQEYDIAWTAEAWIINKDAITTWDVNWEWLYGKLPAGEYRIGKEIMNFEAPEILTKKLFMRILKYKQTMEERLQIDEIVAAGKAVCCKSTERHCNEDFIWYDQ